MISKQSLLERIKALENQLRGDSYQHGLVKQVKALEGGPTLSVPVVDKDGEPIEIRSSGITFGNNWFGTGPRPIRHERKDISFEDVCKALQDMCGIEITYQEIKGSERVVIYEKEDE